MGIELNDRFRPGKERELFLDFRKMPVLDQPVGLGALRPFDVEEGLLDLRPAPLTPLRLLATMCSRVTTPSRSRGTSGTKMLVG